VDASQPSSPFHDELAFFIKHQEDLVARHLGKALVIRGHQVVGAYDSPIAAYLAAVKEFAPGTFMIQPCEPGPSAYTITISSMNW